MLTNFTRSIAHIDTSFPTRSEPIRKKFNPLDTGQPFVLRQPSRRGHSSVRIQVHSNAYADCLAVACVLFAAKKELPMSAGISPVWHNLRRL